MANEQGRTGFFANLAFMPDPSQRTPITLTGALATVVPAYVALYVMALLVVIPGTKHYRRTLLPVALILAFKSGTTHDFAGSDGEANFRNFGQCLGTLMLAMRLVEWACVSAPLQREPRLASNVWIDAADLITNYRGIGWTWGRGTPLPRETRPVHSKPAFIAHTTVLIFKYIFLYDALNTFIVFVAPPSVSTPQGGSIFDATLAPVKRYAYSSLVTAIYGPVFYLSMNIVYYVATVIALCVPFLNYQPTDWPPYAHAPWLSTSIAEFWGRNWHQTLRRSFSFLSTPLTIAFGRYGTVLGAFLLSGILHDWSTWGMGRGTNFTQTVGFFLAMALGVCLERMFKGVTGRDVSGRCGWAWTMVWTVAWGNILVDAWMRCGLGGGEILPPFAIARPARTLLGWATKTRM